MLVMQGTASREVLDVATLRHYAEDAGKSKENGENHRTGDQPDVPRRRRAHHLRLRASPSFLKPTEGPERCFGPLLGSFGSRLIGHAQTWH